MEGSNPDELPGAEMRAGLAADRYGSPAGTGDAGRLALLVVVVVRGAYSAVVAALRWIVRRMRTRRGRLP